MIIHRLLLATLLLHVSAPPHYRTATAKALTKAERANKLHAAQLARYAKHHDSITSHPRFKRGPSSSSCSSGTAQRDRARQAAARAKPAPAACAIDPTRSFSASDGAVASPNATRVFIWHSERRTGDVSLAFMYKPAVESLRRVFESAGAAERAGAPASSSLSSSSIPSSYLTVVVSACAEANFLAWDWAAPRAGDVVVWLGFKDVSRVPFACLRARGVYSVYYQTEPLQRLKERRLTLPLGALEADEHWDYSRDNIRAAGEHRDKGTQRQQEQRRVFLPILHDPAAESHTIRYNRHRDGCDDTSSDPSSSSSSSSSSCPPLQLLFLGNTEKRLQTWAALTRNATGLWPRHLRAEFGVWNDTAQNNLMTGRADGSSAIFLNLHKEGRRSLEGFRISTLLSHGAIVVSQRCVEADEEGYKGLVDFLKTSDVRGTYFLSLSVYLSILLHPYPFFVSFQIPRRFHELRRWGGPKRQSLANDRRARFAKRFSASEFRSVASECLMRSRERRAATMTTTTTTGGALTSPAMVVTTAKGGAPLQLLQQQQTPPPQQPPPRATASSPPPKTLTCLAPGTVVELRGLQAAEKRVLNGQRAVIIKATDQPQQQPGAVAVALERCDLMLEDGRGPFRLRPANIARVSLQPAAEAAEGH